MQVRRLATWTTVPVVVALALSAGCSGGGGSGSGGADDPVRVGIAEPKHLIPTNTSETSGSQVLSTLYTPLISYDAQHKPREAAAESITSTDTTTWTIKLKSGYTFHNREPVTADSYLNAWNYGAYGPNGQDNNYFFDKVDGYPQLNPLDPDGPEGPRAAPAPEVKTLSGLKKVDDLTFTVRLSAPFSGFRTMLGYTAFYPLPKAAFQSDGVLKPDFEQAPIGNGPFRMRGTWQHDSQIEVERYGAYPGDKPKISRAVFTIYQQPAAEYADLLAGNDDVMKQIPSESLATAETDLGDRYQHSPASSFQFLAFPTFQREFANPQVRKAISMAIDRDEITRSVFRESQQSARSFVSPVVEGYREDTCGAACRFDPAAAQAQYVASGGPPQLQITYNGDGGHADWVDATCNQLKANLGVVCTGAAEPKFADLLTKVEGRQPVGMFRLGWVMDYPSMEDYLGPLYSTTGSSNYYGYSNTQFDQLVREGNEATSPIAAVEKYQQAEDILAEDLPVIPLRFGRNNFGHSARVRNVHLDVFDRVDLVTIEYNR